MYETDATLACQPKTVSQPVNHQFTQDLMDVIGPACDIAEEFP